MAKTGTGGWIIGALAGLGCLGGLGALGAIAAATWLGARSAAVPPEPVVRLEPTASAEVPRCPSLAPGPGEVEQIGAFVELTASSFVLSATDGTRTEIPYEGDAYPFEALRARIAARRAQEPSRRQLHVHAEHTVPRPIAERAAAIAREEGMTEALHCRSGALTEEEQIALGMPARGPEVPAPVEGGSIGEAFGFGGLGAGGTGGSGGTGEGTIGLGNLGTIGAGGAPPLARVRAGDVDVRGSMSREVIRRVVQRHINEVRFCYTQELGQAPGLAGRVLVSFIIAPSGDVQSATIGSSTIDHPRVEGCIVQAVRRWTFPEPDGGGIVGVNYPFDLSPD